MKLALGLKITLYYTLLSVAIVANLYSFYIDIYEVIERSLGRYTIFAQISWLTDKQAISYCSALALISVVLLLTIGYKYYHNNRKAVIFFCIFSLTIFIVTLFAEQLFLFNKPI